MNDGPVQDNAIASLGEAGDSDYNACVGYVRASYHW